MSSQARVTSIESNMFQSVCKELLGPASRRRSWMTTAVPSSAAEVDEGRRWRCKEYLERFINKKGSHQKSHFCFRVFVRNCRVQAPGEEVEWQQQYQDPQRRLMMEGGGSASRQIHQQKLSLQSIWIVFFFRKDLIFSSFYDWLLMMCWCPTQVVSILTKFCLITKRQWQSTLYVIGWWMCADVQSKWFTSEAKFSHMYQPKDNDNVSIATMPYI